MPEHRQTDQSRAIDYRLSHLEKGADYDARLAADAFDSYMAKWEAYWLQATIRALFPGGVPRYLDFACGTGRVTDIVAPFARESIGVDVSTTMLEVARAKCPRVQFVEIDVTREKLEFGSFDLVTAFRFFGNAQDELRDAALRAVVESLRPGGHLIINSHRNPFSLAAVLNRATGGSDDMDLHYFKLKRLVASHGIEIVRVRAIGFWLFRSRMFARAGSRRADVLEQLFKWPVFAPFSPDAFLVGRKPFAR
jgi:SAM-dependent methyltransferase